MPTVSELEHEIRDFINSPRKQQLLLDRPAAWNKVASSLDVIGDTELAFDSYLDHYDPKDDGDKYLLAYGVLQALFLQQDAVRHMAEALDIKLEQDDDLKRIRELRNDSIGHPTKRGYSKEGDSFHFIVRISLCHAGFKMMTTYPDDRNATFMDVNIPDLIGRQRGILEQVLTEVVGVLRNEEAEHREKFRDRPLLSCFPQTLGYYFKKIHESLGDERFGKPDGKMHVDLARDP